MAKDEKNPKGSKNKTFGEARLEYIDNKKKEKK